jgi:hypothetical protein
MPRAWSYRFGTNGAYNTATPPDHLRAIQDPDEEEVYRLAANERNLLAEQFFAETPGAFQVPAVAAGDGVASCWAAISFSAGLPTLKAYEDDMTPVDYTSGVWMRADPVTGTSTLDVGHVYYHQAQYQRQAFNMSQTATAGTYLLYTGHGHTNTGKIVLASGTAGAIAYDVTRNETKSDSGYGLADVARLPDGLDRAGGATNPADWDGGSYLPNDYYLNKLKDRINASVMWEVPFLNEDPGDGRTWAEMTYKGKVGSGSSTNSLSDAIAIATADFLAATVVDGFNPPTGAFTEQSGGTDTGGPDAEPGYVASCGASSWKVVIHNPPSAFTGAVSIHWYVCSFNMPNDRIDDPDAVSPLIGSAHDGFVDSAVDYGASEIPPTWDGKMKYVTGGTMTGPSDWTSPQVGDHTTPPPFPTPGPSGLANDNFVWGDPAGYIWGIVGIDEPAYGISGLPIVLVRYDVEGGFTYKV